MKELDKAIEENWEQFEPMQRHRYKRGKLSRTAAVTQLERLGWKVYAVRGETVSTGNQA